MSTKAKAGLEHQVEELARQIRTHRARYYNQEPEISDEEFDALEDRLRELAPDHAALTEVGAEPEEAAEAPPELDRKAEAEARTLAKERTGKLAGLLEAHADRAYGGEPIDPGSYKALWLALRARDADHPTLARVPPPRGLEWPKASHEIPMGSLNKVNTEEELREWARRCDELAREGRLRGVSSDLAATEKLDGLSLEVVYDGGAIEAAITRGDGVIGERITPNVVRMKGVPARIPHRGRLSLRGEIILKKSDVARFSDFKQKVDRRFERLKSLRNTAAGIARTKDVDAKLLPGCRFLSVMFYDAEGVDGLETERDKLAFLEAQGCETPGIEFGDIESIARCHARYQDGERARLDYDIDGLVVRAGSLHTFTLLGELHHRPRAAVAFKFGHEMEVTTLRKIRWITGDTGRITPIAQIEPVFLAGAEVRQASLHNVAKVKGMGIGPGDQVLVSRRNDVIPYVEKIVVKGGRAEEAPSTCDACGGPVEAEGEYLVCKNEMCPAKRLGRLKIWVKHLGLLEWGERTFERLMERGLASEPADLYRIRAEDIAAIEGFGEVSAHRLLEPLRANMRIPFPTFIAALGIGTVSRETAKLLARSGYDSVEKIAGATTEDLARIEGLGEIKAGRIIEGVRARLPEIERLRKAGVTVVPPEERGPLAGLSFCFSGAHSRPRKELQRIVEENGGSVASSVTKGVHYLVLADPSSASSKADKARKLGTEIIDEPTFERIVREKGGEL